MTAVTRAGTLSRVMISCGGTSMVTVLRSILTILSTTGRRMKSPGPLGPPCTLPILKITPRSYSLTILMALSMTETTTIATTTTAMAAIPIPTACNYNRLAISRVGLLGGERQHRPPTFSVHEHPPCGLHSYETPYDAHLADHPLHAGKSRLAS